MPLGSYYELITQEGLLTWTDAAHVRTVEGHIGVDGTV